ncbi:MAG TPA: AAA family ATPase [Sedimentisphaerales bacterium]|nr:AAA family ATPase [Sedimentisphaerales bacterium]
MAFTIAISGKGGSGKTTLAAMIIRALLERADKGAVLAVDADPNSCLGLTLGVEPVGIVAEIREKARAQAPSNAGMDRVRSVEYGIQQAITEARGFDLLTMGQPEGPSCYCAVNNMLRKFLDGLGSQYKYVVIDNEAGMEHLSRRTTNNVDVLCIVAEPTAVGEVTARRIFTLARKLPITVKRIGVLWSRSDQSKELDEIDVLGHIPYDEGVCDAAMQGKTVFDLEDDSPAFAAARNILEDMMVLNA